MKKRNILEQKRFAYTWLLIFFNGYFSKIIVKMDLKPPEHLKLISAENHQKFTINCLI